MGTLTNMVYPTDRVDTIMATLTHLVYLTKRVGTIMGYIDQQGVHICIYIYTLSTGAYTAPQDDYSRLLYPTNATVCLHSYSIKKFGCHGLLLGY